MQSLFVYKISVQLLWMSKLFNQLYLVVHATITLGKLKVTQFLALNFHCRWSSSRRALGYIQPCNSWGRQSHEHQHLELHDMAKPLHVAFHAPEVSVWERDMSAAWERIKSTMSMLLVLARIHVNRHMTVIQLHVQQICSQVSNDYP